MTTGILFVDDDPDILQGLRRSMKRNRKRFDMRFVSSGAEALEALAETPADIVISDMRMPGMDGGELLSEVRTRFPATIRMILSGFAEKEAVMRTVGPAHQYLSKPCDAETLYTSIDRALSLQEFLESKPLRSFVAGLTVLPTLPESVAALIDKLDSNEPAMDCVAAAIAKDISMTAQVLKISNSAYFASVRNITNMQQAIQMLGFDTIKSLALESGIFNLHPETSQSADVIKQLNDCSIGIGMLAKGIASLEGMDAASTELASCAGTLSHVGTLALLHRDLEQFNQATTLAKTENIQTAAAEKRVCGASHAEVGAYLLGLWGFANPIVEAVAYHHSPAECPATEFSIVTAVYVAQHLNPALAGGAEMLQELESTLDMEYLESIGAAHRATVWRDFVVSEIEKRTLQ